MIPSGRYELDPETGGPLPGTYRELPACDRQRGDELCVDKSLDAQFRLLWRPRRTASTASRAPRGDVGADEEGFLYGSAQIFLFVLAVGAFITMTMKTGAIQTGIGRLALRFRNSPARARRRADARCSPSAARPTACGRRRSGSSPCSSRSCSRSATTAWSRSSIIFLGAGTGVLASTVNPFATGVASDAAGISISDGIGLRVVMWVVLVPMAIGYVLWYANRVRKDPRARSSSAPRPTGRAAEARRG